MTTTKETRAIFNRPNMPDGTTPEEINNLVHFLLARQVLEEKMPKTSTPIHQRRQLAAELVQMDKDGLAAMWRSRPNHAASIVHMIGSEEWTCDREVRGTLLESGVDRLVIVPTEPLTVIICNESGIERGLAALDRSQAEEEMEVACALDPAPISGTDTPADYSEPWSD